MPRYLAFVLLVVHSLIANSQTYFPSSLQLVNVIILGPFLSLSLLISPRFLQIHQLSIRRSMSNSEIIKLETLKTMPLFCFHKPKITNLKEIILRK
jgi:hypothetical protein